MKRLLLFRHAKSSWSRNGLADHDRPLSGRGRRAAPAMGRTLAALGLVPARVLCSTSQRTRQTLQLAAEDWSPAPQTEYLAALYHAGPATLEALVRRHGAGAETLMLVGHQPGMQEFALDLIRDGERAARARLETKFPTAALAVIEFPIDDWHGLEAGTGRLMRYVRPRDLDV
ncbi:MAG: SixA phosphatase family protein [Wenzhouxiangella sp.]